MTGQLEKDVVERRAAQAHVADADPGATQLGSGLLDEDEALPRRNALGRYEAAREAAWQAFERGDLGFGPLIVPELAEAASRTGDAARLRTALDWLTERARVTPTEWALGIEARVRALSSDGADAEALYREALERLGRTRLRIELARTHLLYGEWLRREQRRVDARDWRSIPRTWTRFIG